MLKVVVHLARVQDVDPLGPNLAKRKLNQFFLLFRVIPSQITPGIVVLGRLFQKLREPSPELIKAEAVEQINIPPSQALVPGPGPAAREHHELIAKTRKL